MFLLSEVRKKLLLIWLSFSALLLIFFLLQILNGKYAGMENIAWGWIFAQLLPGLVLLLAATLLHLNRGKYLLYWVSWAIAGLSAFYLFFVLVSLAGISGGSAGQSLEEGFVGSYRYLLPLQVLVLAAFSVLFFKKESLFQPNEAKMRDHAQALLAKSTSAENSDRRAALEFFVAADLPAMLDYLEQKIRAKIPPDKIPPDVLMLKNKLTEYQKNILFDLISRDEARKEYAHICYAALGLVGEI